jgi:hypothetical protein
MCNACKPGVLFPNDGPTFVPAFAGDVGASAAIGELGWVPTFAGDVVVSDGFGWNLACPKLARRLNILPVSRRLSMGNNLVK